MGKDPPRSDEKNRHFLAAGIERERVGEIGRIRQAGGFRLERARGFTWERSTQGTLAAFERVLSA